MACIEEEAFVVFHMNTTGGRSVEQAGSAGSIFSIANSCTCEHNALHC